jgi:hypothetical protein
MLLLTKCAYFMVNTHAQTLEPLFWDSKSSGIDGYFKKSCNDKGLEVEGGGYWCWQCFSIYFITEGIIKV